MSKQQLKDGKHLGAQLILGPVNYLATTTCLKGIDVAGANNMPDAGAFLLVCNHTSRWDGLIVQRLIGRPANFMVSPNELKGLQGLVLRFMGAFPADARYDLVDYSRRQASKGEALVVFPEGNIFQTGTTQRFKSGAAKLALSCAANGQIMPIIPMAISYTANRSARVTIGPQIDISSYLDEYRNAANTAVRCLTERLYREVCILQEPMGQEGDRLSLYSSPPDRKWLSGHKAS